MVVNTAIDGVISGHDAKNASNQWRKASSESERASGLVSGSLHFEHRVGSGYFALATPLSVIAEKSTSLKLPSNGTYQSMLVTRSPRGATLTISAI